MIAVSAALVMAALGLLVAGIIVPYMVLVYLSIGVSVLAALLLGAGAFQRRGELFAPEAPAYAAAQGEAEQMITAAKADALAGTKPTGTHPTSHATAASTSRPPATPEDPVAPPSPETMSATIPPGAPVSVTPARRTYHLASCRHLRGRSSTQLTYAEAREEGYTACSSCLPDTVLAARGETPATAGNDNEDTLTTDTAQAPPWSNSPTADAPVGNTAPAEGGADEVDTGASAVTPATAIEAEGSPGALRDTGDLPTEIDSGGAIPVDNGDENDTGKPKGQAGLVGVVESSHRYHRLTCAVVEDAVQDGIELTTMGRDEAEDAQCTPCTVCRP